jgi:branched-chain amino acid transport system permease protein
VGFYIDILVYAALSLIAVQGVFLLTGVTGLFSFGQAGFMAIGAYVGAILNLKYDLPLVLCLLGGVLVAAVVSVVVGYPTIRLKTNYFAIATLGLAEAIRATLNLLVGMTGGATGVGGIPPLTQPWMVFVTAILSIWITVNFVKSRHGRACVAIRTDEVAAHAIGINAQKYRQIVFTLSACLAALSGGLMAFYVSYIEPDMFGVTRSVELIIFVFFGGLRSVTGAVVGTLILMTLPSFMQFLSEWRMAIFTSVILVIILYRPGGLMGDWELSFEWLRSLVSRRPRAAKGGGGGA